MDKQKAQKEMEPIRLFLSEIYRKLFTDGQTFPWRFDPKLEFLDLQATKEAAFLSIMKSQLSRNESS